MGDVIFQVGLALIQPGHFLELEREMNKLAILGVTAILVACQSVGGGGGTVQQLSDQYYACVFEKINLAYGDGIKGDAAIDKAFAGCRSEGKNYGTKLAADAGVDPAGQWQAAEAQMLPIIEKKARATFQEYLKRHGG